MVYKRVCRDCPVPGCGAKYLVRLANHLADVHLCDIDERRKYLQEAKLQPKIKFFVYSQTTDEDDTMINSSKQQERVYELSQSRQKKAVETKVKRKSTRSLKNYIARGEVKTWMTMD